MSHYPIKSVIFIKLRCELTATILAEDLLLNNKELFVIGVLDEYVKDVYFYGSHASLNDENDN